MKVFRNFQGNEKVVPLSGSSSYPKSQLSRVYCVEIVTHPSCKNGQILSNLVLLSVQCEFEHIIWLLHSQVILSIDQAFCESELQNF